MKNHRAIRPFVVCVVTALSNYAATASVDLTTPNQIFPGQKTQKTNIQPGKIQNKNSREGNGNLAGSKSDFYDRRGLASFRAGQWKQAMADYNLAIAVGTTCHCPYVHRGELYIQLGQYEKALSDYTKVVAMQPAADYLAMRGAVYRHLGANDKAAADFRTAIALGTDSINKSLGNGGNLAMSYNNRAWAYALAGRFKESRSDALASIKFNANLSCSQDTLGYASAGLGLYYDALAAYDYAIRLNPGNGEQYCHRAQVYEKLGKQTLAQVDWREARAHGFVRALD